MKKNKKDKNKRRLSVRGVHRAKPDMRRLARVLIEFAQAEAEAAAAAEFEKSQRSTDADDPQAGTGEDAA